MPTVKYGGGSVMLWACFYSEGPRNFVKVQSIMNFLKYRNIPGPRTILRGCAKRNVQRSLYLYSPIS